MTIGRTPNGIITLTPDTGKAVTNGETIAEYTVYLGKNDKPENWRDCEATEEEAEISDYQNALDRLGVDAHD